MARFKWKNRKQFISLVNMLSLRNGGQLGPNDEEDGEDEVDVGIRTNEPSVGDSEENELKERFLDRFAELMSRNKGGKHVCCVALQESGDRHLDEGVKISLVVARNNTFNEQDTKFCSTLERLLATISASVYEETIGLPVIEKKLWDELVCYYQPRIDRYTRSLRANLDAFKNAGSLTNIPPYGTESQLPQDSNIESTTFCDDPGLGPYSAETHDAYMRFA